MFKKISLIIILLSSLSFAQMADGNNEQAEFTMSAGDDSVLVDMYSLFGDKGTQLLKATYFMTDTNMVSTGVTFEIYDSKNAVYKTLQVTDSTDYSIPIVSSKTYPLTPAYFWAFDKFIMRFDSTETYTKSIVFGGRVF